MHAFVRNLITEWRRLELPFSGGTIVVAVSGGTDSNSLLVALHDLTQRKKFGHRIVAAHFNHGLRGAASESDEEYLRQLTVRLGVEFAVDSAQLGAHGNLEQNAREARYKFLRRTAKAVGAFAVLTGHTVNDQAETFLINLIRGSGPEGLSGMKPVRPLEDETSANEENGATAPGEIDVSPPLPFSATRVLLVRPLLRWAKRQSTEGFCHDLDIECCHDAMNDDTAFRRVRIRRILLPLLEDFNPRIVDTLAQTAELIAQTQKGSENSRQTEGKCNHLSIKALKDLENPLLYTTIRSWLRAHRGTTRRLELKHIQAIERLAFSVKSGRTAELPGGSVIKTAGKLVYKENKVEN